MTTLAPVRPDRHGVASLGSSASDVPARLAAAVRDLEGRRGDSGPLPAIAERLIVDALHERERATGVQHDAEAIATSWRAIRESLGLDPARRESQPLSHQTFGYVAARLLGTGGPLNAERLHAIDRQRASPMRLDGAARAPWPVGTSKHLIDLARDTLGPSRALDFLVLWKSWHGPKVGDADVTGQQRTFTRVPWKEKVDAADMRRVLDGEVLVMQHPRTHQLDFIARDHNTLDVLLAAWSLGQPLPERILHLDRHSDYTKPHIDEGTFGPRFLAGMPQAAAWWALLDFIVRPDGTTPIADPKKVDFVTYLSPKQRDDEARQLNGARHSPWLPRDTKWPRVADRLRDTPPDFVSYDLDLSMPSDQMNGTKDMLRDPRFRTFMGGAGMRLFVISPSFSGGGDLVRADDVVHSPATYTRVLNVVRRIGAGPA